MTRQFEGTACEELLDGGSHEGCRSEVSRGTRYLCLVRLQPPGCAMRHYGLAAAPPQLTFICWTGYGAVTAGSAAPTGEITSRACMHLCTLPMRNYRQCHVARRDASGMLSAPSSRWLNQMHCGEAARSREINKIGAWCHDE